MFEKQFRAELIKVEMNRVLLRRGKNYGFSGNSLLSLTQSCRRRFRDIFLPSLHSLVSHLETFLLLPSNTVFIRYSTRHKQPAPIIYKNIIRVTHKQKNTTFKNEITLNIAFFSQSLFTFKYI